MRKYICLGNTFFAIFLLTLVSCKGVFILDPIDPRLPKYTEEGNNVAGAFVNQDVWKSVVGFGLNSSRYKPYLTVYSNKDSLVLSFDGQIVKGENVLADSYITFHLKDLNIHTFSDLKNLKNKIIQLDGVKNYSAITRTDNSSSSSTCNGTAGIGQIYFKNVTVNESQNSVILSGTFGFTITNSNCGTTEVSYGRFDYSFQKDSNLWI
jgi:hypothetical protein